MPREFEIFSKPSAPLVAVKRGFSWPGFFFEWIWAFARGLWLEGSLLFLATIGLKFVSAHSPGLTVALSLIVGLFVGFRGNSWRSEKLERQGYRFLGIVPAASPAAALAIAARGEQLSFVSQRASVSFLPTPAWLQQLLAIAWLTWKAAFRFRLFLVIAVLLLMSVVGLPILIKDDGTARGFTQILLTYTLSVITALLGLSTLWLSCGTLARDIEECQIQMIAVKPVARWQIWLGKWLGIITLNAALLTLSGLSVYTLLLWRATKLPVEQQKVLRNEVLIARGSAKEALGDINAEIDKVADEAMKERLKQSPVSGADLGEVRRLIREGVKANYQVVPPGVIRQWHINLGAMKNSLRDRPLQLRIRFNAAAKSPTGTFAAFWRAGVPEKTRLWANAEPMSMAPDTFHEFEIPANLLDDQGMLTIGFRNMNNISLLFPLEDGLEVLYRESGFGLNFTRGLAIIFCWMALLAAIGLAAASFLSFPVAAFFALGILTLSLSTGTLNTVVADGTIGGFNEETGQAGHSVLDFIIVPAFRAALSIINLAKDFSPIDALSNGRSIPWNTVGQAFGRIVLLLGGIFAAFGIFIFNRRELATAQGNQ